MPFHKININSTDFELAPKQVKSDIGSTENKNCFIPYLSNGPGRISVDYISGETDMAASTILISPDSTDLSFNTPRFFYNPSQNAVGASKFIGDLDGTASSANRAETASAALGVRITNTKPTSALTYYITFVSGFASETNYDVRANDGIKYFTREGTAEQVGIATLAVGNDIAEGTAGNKQGSLRIYGKNTGFGDIYGPDITSSTKYYLPNTTGTFVTHVGNGVGSTSRPVYIASTGRATTCTWGTSMTNGTNYYLIGTTGSTGGLTYNTNVKVNSGIIYAKLDGPVQTTNTTTNASYYISFVNSSGSGMKYSYVDSGLYYNPYTNELSASGGFYERSDERLKDFQEDIEVNFSYLRNISKKYYSWKDDTTYTRHIGTSAQEVQKYYPELVNTDDDGYLTMNYDKLSVVALKAIDVLHEEVTELKKENADLKERLARLEELILNR